MPVFETFVSFRHLLHLLRFISTIIRMILNTIKKEGLFYTKLFCLFICLLLLLIPFSSSAQRTKISLTPLTFEFTAEPGESVEGLIKVSNHRDSVPVNIKMEFEDIFPEGEEGRLRSATPDEERGTFSLSPWISVDSDRFPLRPGGEEKVKFTIDVPENAEPGGYYVSVLAGTTDVEAEGTGVAVLTRVASIILLTVPGEAKEDFRTLGITAPSYVEKGPVEFSVRFENKGTVHSRPDAEVVVTNMLGMEVARIPLESKLVLPNAIRRIDVEWEDAGLIAGKYTATLEGVYGANSLPLDSASVSFWAFPWKLALGALLLITLLYITRRRWIVAIRILVQGEKGLSK